jgi:hypothetical protein
MKRTGEDLGLGTHIYYGDILLDSGKKIHQSLCNCEEVGLQGTPVFPGINVRLTRNIRTFQQQGYGMFPTEIFLNAWCTVKITQLCVFAWNHGDYLAGMVESDRHHPLWVLISELQPEEIPR